MTRQDETNGHSDEALRRSILAEAAETRADPFAPGKRGGGASLVTTSMLVLYPVVASVVAVVAGLTLAGAAFPS